MARTYFITTDRIAFSQWQEQDAELATLLWGDSRVTRYICASGSFSQAEVMGRLEREIRQQAEHHVQYWPIFTRDTAELIGCCGFRFHCEGCYELGFHLRPEFWRQGYAPEAARAAIAYAFIVLGAEKVIAGRHPDNKASGKVLERLGFAYIGDMFYEPTGLYHPSYQMTREAWKAKTSV